MIRSTSLRSRRRSWRAAAGVLVGLAAIGYFGYHSVAGERGIDDWFEVTRELERLEERHQLNAARIAYWEHQVSLLRDDSLDPDLLDERARHSLGLAHPNEIVVLNP
jgi:cell division protein FtsB